MQRELLKHTFNEKVRWGDCDMLGHVNNTTYLQYIESARMAYIHEVMNTTLTTDSVEGWVIVDLNCTFAAQLKYPAKIQVCSAISRIGNSSATIEAAVFIQSEESPVFTSTATIVWCNYKEGKSSRIPDEIRRAINTFEQQ